MTIKSYGAGVSGYLEAEGRSYETTIYQASKPVLDRELNLVQDVSQAGVRSILQLAQSGWLSADVVDTASHSSGICLDVVSTGGNALFMPALKALVNGWLISVEGTGDLTLTVLTNNHLSLGAAPVGAGSKRTDLVILEVWRCLLSASPSTAGKSQTAKIWRNGNVKIATTNDAALNFVDNILDSGVGAETTKRVQVQYRLRVIPGVDLAVHPYGMSDPTVLASSVPPIPATVDGNVTAFTYSSQSAAGDGGLWRAGDGNPANSLGTVDGYMYALPLLAVFRRNSTAFARDTNHNGAGAWSTSGRPDGLYHNVINARDVLDLRTNISLQGWSYPELLSKNVNSLLDNTLKTEIMTTALGGGSTGHSVLWADEIGPTDTAGAQRIRAGFDGVCRRFSDRPIIETVVVKYIPTNQVGAGANWTTASTLQINPTALPVYPHASANFLAAAPSSVVILDVLYWVESGTAGTTPTTFYGSFDDVAAGFPNAKPWTATDFRQISGLGTNPMGTVTLAPNPIASTASDLYVVLVISYPSGREVTAGGLAKTPTTDYGASSFVLETPAQLPAGAPHLFQAVEGAFDAAHREVKLTYKTLSTTFAQRFASVTGWTLPANTSFLFFPDRVASTPTPTLVNTTLTKTYTGPVTLSSCGHFIFFSTLAANWAASAPAAFNVITTTFQASRPIPNNNVQFTLWYETRAPQPIRSSLLGTTLTVIPRLISPHLYALVTGSASLGESYPFPQQYVQSPGVYPSSGGSFSGDHELDGTGLVSVADFSAETGFIQVPVLVPAVPEPQSLTLLRVGGDVDIEGRTYFKEVPAGYIPAAFGQPLSDAKRHKNVLPMVAELAADGPIGSKGTLVLVLLSRWANFDSSNFVGFDSALTQNFTSASVYRLKGGPVNNRRV